MKSAYFVLTYIYLDCKKNISEDRNGYEIHSYVKPFTRIGGLSNL